MPAPTKRLVSEGTHGGFINVYSELHKGTQFSLYLPALDIPGAPDSAAAQTDLPLGQGELILVVDDEESIREITRGTLETFGYSVLTASDGTEALAIYADRKNEIAVVLTDMRRLMEVVRNGRVDFTPLLTHSFSLDKIGDAYSLFGERRDGVMKVAIRP